RASLKEGQTDFTLRWWLDSELSGSEYRTAIAHLEGRGLDAAKLEIESDPSDAKEVEKTLRALTPAQIQQLNEPEFAKLRASIQSTLEDSLSGTNLDVAKALLVGRVARADALRLRDATESARGSQDDDKLHDQWSNIDPKRLPEVRRELADILAGHAMSAT